MALKTKMQIITPTGKHLDQIQAIERNGKPLSQARKGILEKYLLAIHYLIARNSVKKPDRNLTQENQYVNISRRDWEKLLNKDAANYILRDLVNHGIFELNSHYSCPKKDYSCPKKGGNSGKSFSKSYRFTPSWRKACAEITEISYTKPKGSNLLSKKLEMYNGDFMPEAYRDRVRELLERVTLNLELAHEILDTITVTRNWGMMTKLGMTLLIEGFDENKRFTIATTNRFCCIGNQIPSETRDAILIDGEATDELDISCSNPTILYSFYPMGSEEASKYKKLAKAGQLYDQIASDLKMTRKRAKDGTYKVMFGGRDVRIEKWFQSNFPELSEIMKKYPKGDLSRELQKKEASVIVTGLMLKSGIPCLSIHDGLRVKPCDTEKAKRLIKKLFIEKFRIDPNITTRRAGEALDLAA